MTWSEIIGWGDYPQGGYRASLKPCPLFGIAYECPKCETASIHHATPEYIKDVLECEFIRRGAENEQESKSKGKRSKRPKNFSNTEHRDGEGIVHAY